MVVPKVILTDTSRGASELWWYPYNPAAVGIAQGIVGLARRGGNKLLALGQLLKHFPRRFKD